MQHRPRTALALAQTAAAAALISAAGAHAASWDESLQGDLSGDRFAPSLLTLEGGLPAANGEIGHNVVSGQLGAAADGTTDRDYLSIVVPEGFVLAELRVGQQTQFGGNGSFLGIAEGAVMPVAPDSVSASGLLGWRVVGAADRGTNILDDMGSAGNGASGFTVALPAGSYTLWAQELAAGSFPYRYNLVLSPVPEPAPLALLALGFAALFGARRGMHKPSIRCEAESPSA